MAAIDTPTAPPTPTASYNDATSPATGDEITHAYCARCWRNGVDPLTAACGFQPTRRPERPASANDQRCVVCVDLMWAPCPRCGR